MHTRLQIGLIWLSASLLRGQSADKAVTFDAASVKPAALVFGSPGKMVFSRPSGGPGTNDPGRIFRPNQSLMSLLMTAYNVKIYQIDGPAWLDTERFDITATMRPDTTMDQVRVMWQNLLADRFRLKVHRESRQQAVYSLVVAKGGPKMQEAGRGASAPPPPPQPKMTPDGPVLASSAGPTLAMTGRGHLMGRAQTMHDLASFLSVQIGRPTTDDTGLTAKYDFLLTYSDAGLEGPTAAMRPMPDSDILPSLFTATQAQLGLKLEPKKGPVEVIVADHIERKPSEN